MFTQPQVRFLKIAVVVMGMLLVGGFAFVLAAIVYQAAHSGQAGRTLPAAAHAAPELALPEGASIGAMSLDGSRLALHITTKQGGEIIVIDLASGKAISRVKLKPQ
jgi:hypothetical protein